MNQEGKRNALIYLFGRLWHYSEGTRRHVVWYWIMFIAAASLTLFVPPLIWADIMDTIQVQGITAQSVKTLYSLLGITLVIEVVFWALHGPARLIEQANAFRVRSNYRKHLLKGVLTLPLEWHTDHHSGDTIDKIEKGATGLYQFSGSSFEVIYSLVRLVGSYAILSYFSPPSAVIVAVMILITGWITMRFDRVIVGQYRKLNRAENEISQSVFDVVSNITSVIILRVERLVFSAIVGKVEQPFGLFKRNIYLNEWKWFLTSFCCAVMAVAVLGSYFWSNIGTAHSVLVGTAFILISYTRIMSELFFKFTSMYGDVLKRRAGVANAEELSADFRSENFTNHVLPERWRTLTIESLYFSYGGERDDPHLDGISLSIYRGERIAFVGETGSGKTTLLKVMRDLYHPQGLLLSVDGHMVPHGFAGISRAIALVPQDPEIFATTILENITLGAEYEPDVVKRFTDMACFTDVVAGLPHGLASSIKEKGVNLSGGQQQRLALSRGLLACHDKDIVLLDEPTSSLDMLTEMAVYRNIFDGFRGKTIISSIHRLHLLPLFDRVCVFENGKIIATGSPSEVRAICPSFNRLWKAMQEVTADGVAVS